MEKSQFGWQQKREKMKDISGSVMQCLCYLHSMEILCVAVHFSQSLIVTRLRQKSFVGLFIGFPAEDTTKSTSPFSNVE